MKKSKANPNPNLLILSSRNELVQSQATMIDATKFEHETPKLQLLEKSINQNSFKTTLKM